jgi:Tfp pilus assembly protein PilV
MRTAANLKGAHGLRQRGFTIVEAVFSIAMLLILVTGVYSGLAYSFNAIRMARENTRATQILIEKTEQLRLYNWDQLTSGTNAFLPANPFLVPYYADSMGVVYTGEVSMAAVNLGTPYANAMRELTITLKWQTGKLQRSRSLTTFVSQNGVQNYIY